MRNGNGWALTVNKTILDLVEYTVEAGKLIITKSDKKRDDI